MSDRTTRREMLKGFGLMAGSAALAPIVHVAPVFAAANEEYVSPFEFNDPSPKVHKFSERASVIDPRAKSHPEINYILEKDGKPRDTMTASVDTRVKPRGRLLLSLMGGSLFSHVNGYGMHAIAVPYADGWFSLVTTGKPKETWRGDVRLEAIAGEDVSALVDIPKPDSLMERAYQFLKWLAKTHPLGKWDYFLTKDGSAVRWEAVTLAGLSHGSTTAARFAMHVKVDRVVCFSGPRDQDQSWQAGPSATPPERYFGFSHVLDAGWVGKHYCRSWEMLGLHKFGPIVDVEKSKPPYENTRRLVTSRDGGGRLNHHNGVAPNDFAYRDQEKKFVHAEVWKYLFTHSISEVGKATELDPGCQGKPK